MLYFPFRCSHPKDIDLLIQPSPANGKAVYTALQKFGAPLAGLTAADFIERDKFFRMGRAPVMVDILPEISGIDFDRAWQRRVEVCDRPRKRPRGVFYFERGFNRVEARGGKATGHCRRCRPTQNDREPTRAAKKSHANQKAAVLASKSGPLVFYDFKRSMLQPSTLKPPIPALLV